jgi:hypothetical protein
MSNAAISNVIGVVLIVAWLAITGFTFSRAKKRWQLAESPLPKRAFVYGGLVIFELLLILIFGAIWALLTAGFFCTPPGCF